MESRTKSPIYAADPTSDPPETEVLRSTAKWYEDLAAILSYPRRATNHIFVIMSVLMIAALAIAYWGVSTEHPNVAFGAFVVFLAAMLIWIAISMFLIGTVIIDVAKWLIARRNRVRFKQ